MTTDDRTAFARGLYALGETFGEPVSELRAEAYFDALSDLGILDVLGAMRTAIRTSKFFPRPVEIREQIEGNPQDRAELAWNAVLRLVRRVGYYGKPDWPDEPTKRAALELFGGWPALCEQLPAGGPELLGIAKGFKASYVAYAHRDLSDVAQLTRAEATRLLEDVYAHASDRKDG
jgi:hypothetical protein